MFGGRRRRNGEGIVYDDCCAIDGQPLPISIEAKAHARLQLQTKWIEQAVRNSGGRPWVVVQRPLHSKRIYATVDLDFLVDVCTKAGLIHQTEGGAHGFDGGSDTVTGTDPGSTDPQTDRTVVTD